MQTATDLFAGVLPFLRTAEERSFRRAAQRLGVSTAAVSKAIARLEEDLGVRLLNRTSRQVSLTAEGAQYLERCREAVAHLQAGRDLVTQAQRAPRGRLSLSLPFVLGRPIVAALARLAGRYPGLSFSVALTDRYSTLIDESIDVAVRIGELADSSLVARALRTPRWTTLASPAYLARRGVPAHPDDLAGHACLKFVAPRGKPREWTFRASPGGPPVVVPTEATLLIDQGELLLEAAAAGMGVCQVLDFMTDESIRTGRLVEVLADFAAPGPPIHALCLPGRQRSPNVRALFDLLDEVLGRRG